MAARRTSTLTLDRENGDLGLVSDSRSSAFVRPGRSLVLFTFARGYHNMADPLQDLTAHCRLGATPCLQPGRDRDLSKPGPYCMAMPKRDRNHELETLSQRAFEGALPPSVVVRPISDDYGIDREVEVFVDGKTTGLTFKVQLKGTDKSGSSRRVKRASVEYWKSLDVPVLLVSFEAGADVLRGRWVHSIGLEGPDTGAETITVHMDPSLHLHNTSAEKLASDLQLIRTVRRGEVPLPTPVRLDLDERVGVSSTQSTAALLNLSRRTRNPMRSAVDAEEAALVVVVSPSLVSARLPLGVGSCSLHVDGRYLDSTPSGLAELALMLCAGAVATVNEDCAREWLLGISQDSPWWSLPEFSERLLPVLAHRDSIALVFRIHAQLISADDPAADLYLGPLVDLAREADSETIAAYSTQVRSHLGDSWDDGRKAFNLANIHRMRRDFATAVELLEEAAAKAPRYLEDQRYHDQLAGALWEVGRFDESAAAYTQALAVGTDPHRALPLLADSLMYAGHYAAASAALAPWKPNNTRADKAGLLRRVILDHILNYVGVSEQDRAGFDPDAATSRYFAAQGSDTLTEEVLLDLLRTTDALHPQLWIQLVGFGRDGIDFRAALILALMMTDEPFIWVFAMVGAIQESVEDDVLRAVIDQARFLCSEAFYEATLAFAADQDEGNAEYLRELVSAAYAAEPEALTNHMRAVDRAGAQWVIDLASYPMRPQGPFAGG